MERFCNNCTIRKPHCYNSLKTHINNDVPRTAHILPNGNGCQRCCLTHWVQNLCYQVKIFLIKNEGSNCSYSATYLYGHCVPFRVQRSPTHTHQGREKVTHTHIKEEDRRVIGNWGRREACLQLPRSLNKTELCSWESSHPHKHTNSVPQLTPHPATKCNLSITASESLASGDPTGSGNRKSHSQERKAAYWHPLNIAHPLDLKCL